MIRTITAATLLLAAGALVPFSAGAKPEYTAACTANTRDLTLTWTGGTDATARATLEWADGSDETVSLDLPKQGGLRTVTWTNLGSQSGPLAGVAVQFARNNGSLPPAVRVSCSPGSTPETSLSESVPFFTREPTTAPAQRLGDASALYRWE